MTTQELLKMAPRMKRLDLYYLVRCGYLGTKQIATGKRAKVIFSLRDGEKLRLMWRFRQDGDSWELAAAKAEDTLSQQCGSEGAQRGPKMQLLGADGSPMRNEKYKIEPYDIIFETDSDGYVERVAISSDLAIRMPVFKKIPDNVAELIFFLKSLAKKGLIITDKNLDALQFLMDKYDNFIDKHGKRRATVYDSIEKALLKQISDLISVGKTESLDVVPEEVFRTLAEMDRLTFDSVDIGKVKIHGKDLHKHPDTAPLFYAGVYGWASKEDRKVALGYTIGDGMERMPDSISLSLKNIDNLFSGRTYRSLLAHQLSHQYGLDVSNVPPLDSWSISEEDFSHCLKLLNEAVSYLRRKYGERFTAIQDVFTFYEQAISLYTPSSEKIYIYSTTSGLVVPEEYFGDTRQMKSDYRRKYFDTGIAGKQAGELPKLYQWDKDTTARSLWEGFRRKSKDGFGDMYKKSAADILTQFLMVPNLEISEASFDSAPWKKYMTLNTAKSILFSVRDKEIKQKIAHGFLAAVEGLLPEKLKTASTQKHENLFHFVEDQYAHEQHQVLKSRKENFTDSRKVATEIVEMLLDRGEKLPKSKD
jgi:hypothetical protein